MKHLLNVLTFAITILLLLQYGCKNNGITPCSDCPVPCDSCPEPPVGCPFKHVEVDDTTREYVFWDSTEINLCTALIYVWFVEGTSDSAAMALAQSYGLTLKIGDPSSLHYIFQVPAGKRAEEYFTPYGKPNKQNFGNESIVQVAFMISGNGTIGYTDEMNVQFDSTVTDSAIDSINTLYNVQIKRTFFIGGQRWHFLRVTKESPYSCFDMANLYHCLPEVVESAANIWAFQIPISPCHSN